MLAWVFCKSLQFSVSTIIIYHDSFIFLLCLLLFCFDCSHFVWCLIMLPKVSGSCLWRLRFTNLISRRATFRLLFQDWSKMLCKVHTELGLFWGALQLWRNWVVVWFLNMRFIPKKVWYHGGIGGIFVWFVMPRWIHSICIKQYLGSVLIGLNISDFDQTVEVVGWGKSIYLKEVFCNWPKLSESNCTLEDRLDGRVWIGMCRRHLLSLVIDFVF